MPAPQASYKASRIAFQCAFVCILGPAYFSLAREGLRATLPGVFGLKLHKLPIPFFAPLEDYKSTYDLDVACLSAIGLFFFVSAIWDVFMQTVLYHEGTQNFDPRTNVRALREVLHYGGIALLVIDAVVIFVGVLNQAMWSAGVFSAVVVTALYVALMVMGAATAAYLKHN